MNKRYNIKKLSLVLAIFIVFLLGFNWISTHAFIEVDMSGADGEYTYRISGSGIKNPTEKRTSEKKVKKLLKKGSYEFVAQKDNKSFIAYLHVGGFFGSSKVSAALENEVARSYVGNEPGPCMMYVNNILHTSSCSGDYEEIKTHIPATSSTPTYVMRDDAVLGFFEGFVNTPEGDFVLVRHTISEDDTMMHVLYKIITNEGVASTITKVLSLPELDASKSYTALPYESGFVFYESDLSKVYSLSSVNGKPSLVDIQPNDKTLLGPNSRLQSSSSGIYALYTSLSGEGKAAKRKQATEVVVFENGTKKSYRFNKTFNSVVGCGKNIVCTLSGSTASVYDISTDKPRKLYEIPDAKELLADKNMTVVATGSGIVQLNSENGTGHYLYSYNSYSFNALQLQNDQVFVSLTSSKGNKVALRLNAADKSPDFIDKKITELQKINEISAMSIYKNYIYVTPNVGELTYVEGEGFIPETANIQAANKAIDEAVKRIGFEGYTVISTQK